jgi:hypothetical protein
MLSLALVFGCQEKEAPPAQAPAPAEVGQPAAKVWKRYKPPVGEASFLFPGDAAEIKGSVRLKNSTTYGVKVHDKLVYLVMVTPLEVEPTKFAAMAQMEKSLAALVKQSEGRIVTEQTFVRDDLICWEAVVNRKDGTAMRSLQFTKGRFFYNLFAHGTQDEVENNDADQFMQSAEFVK